jgi:DNA-binding transcriptional LysR family regulator
METQLLRTLLVLARTGSFTTAATELSLVQSTVTAQVKALERHMGARLFDRLPRGALLTEAGQRAVEHARDVLAAEQRLLDAVRGSEAVEGTVRIGAPESVCAYRLPSRVADLALKLPRVAVHLSSSGTEPTLAGVRSGTLDLGLVLEESVAAPGLDVTAIGTEHIELVSSPTNVPEGRYFLLEEGCSYTDRFVRDLPPSAHITRFGSIEAARSCAVAGLGLAVLPRIAVSDHIAGGSLRSLRSLPPSILHLVSDARRTPSAAVRAVAEALG